MMSKKIVWKQTQGLGAGTDAVTIPIDKDIVAQTRPEVAQMTDQEYFDFIIQKDIIPHNPENIRIEDI